MAGFSRDSWPEDGAERALLEYLDELHREAGQPSFREIGRATALAPSTLSGYFTGRRLITRGALELLAMYLGGDPAKAERLRRRAATERNNRGTAPDLSRPRTGRPREDPLAGSFVGRDEVLRRMDGWLDGHIAATAPALVLTGDPGSGKSAILARLAQLGDPATTERTRVDLRADARNSDSADVLGQIAAAAQVSATSVGELVEVLRDRNRTLTVVLDSVDEAADPAELAREMIRPLIRHAEETGIRLLIGSRRHLVPLLCADERVRVIDLADIEVTDDLAGYATRLLTQRPPRQHGATAMTGLAAAVAARAAGNFLVARLLCASLAITGVAEADLDGRFPLSVGAAMDDYIARLSRAAAGPAAAERRVRDLLRPLAYARGDGLDDEQVWAAMATANGTARYRPEDVRWLRSTAADDLLARRTGPDGTLYRLFHQALVDHLRDGRSEADDERRHVTALLGGAAPAGRRWLSRPRYVRQHLCEHAAAAGELDPFLEEPAFVLASQPAALLRALSAVRTQRGLTLADLYLSLGHHLRDGAIEENASYVELHARQRGLADIAGRVTGLGLARSWSAPWAEADSESRSRVVGTHQSTVVCLTSAVVAGRLLVATADRGGAVGLWEPATAQQVGSLIDLGAPPTALALAEHFGDPVLAATIGRRLVVLNLRTGQRLVDPADDLLDEDAEWVGLLSWEDRCLVAVANGFQLMVQDAAGFGAGFRRTGGFGWDDQIRDLVFTASGDRMLLVVAQGNGVCVLDAVTGQELRRTVLANNGVWGLALARLADGIVHLFVVVSDADAADDIFTWVGLVTVAETELTGTDLPAPRYLGTCQQDATLAPVVVHGRPEVLLCRAGWVEELTPERFTHRDPFDAGVNYGTGIAAFVHRGSVEIAYATGSLVQARTLPRKIFEHGAPAWPPGDVHIHRPENDVRDRYDSVPAGALLLAYQQWWSGGEPTMLNTTSPDLVSVDPGATTEAFEGPGLTVRLLADRCEGEWRPRREPRLPFPAPGGVNEETISIVDGAGTVLGVPIATGLRFGRTAILRSGGGLQLAVAGASPASASESFSVRVWDLVSGELRLRWDMSGETTHPRASFGRLAGRPVAVVVDRRWQATDQRLVILELATGTVHVDRRLPAETDAKHSDGRSRIGRLAGRDVLVTFERGQVFLTDLERWTTTRWTFELPLESLRLTQPDGLVVATSGGRALIRIHRLA